MLEWLRRLRDWLRRDRLDAEMANELEFHRTLLIRDAEASGAGRDEASVVAHRRLGSTLRAREAARDRWSWPWLDHLGQDLRYAVRSLRRTPGFTVGVVLTLAVGVGANAAMFAVIDRLLLRTPPYLRDPSRVHRVYISAFEQNQEQRVHQFEYPRYVGLSRWTSSFNETAALIPMTVTVASGEDPREVEAEAVSASFWRFFAIQPVLGRFFGVEEDQVPYGAAVVVISERYWKAELGGRPDVIGSRLKLGVLWCTIIGIAPGDFVGIPASRSPAVLFIPAATAWAAYGEGADGMTISIPDQYASYVGNVGGVEMIVRRKPTVGTETASADLAAAFRRTWESHRLVDPSVPSVETARPSAAVGPLVIDRCAVSRSLPCDMMVGPEGRIALWVTALSAIVFLVACANVTNLSLARMIGRRREVAMRRALGIGRARLAGQLLLENGLLAMLAGAAGLLLARWTSTAVASLFLPPGDTRSLVDLRTVAMAIAAAVIAGLTTGLVPALRVGQDDLATTIKGGARDGPRHRSRMQSVLVIAQATLSVVLLVGAGLFVRSLMNVRGIRLGYDVGPTLWAFVHVRGKVPTPEQKSLVLTRLRDEAMAIPGVVQASRSNGPVGEHFSLPLEVPGIDSVPLLGEFIARIVSPEYFNTVGTRVIRGRGIDATDRKGAPPVAVVGESMAGRLWPGKPAIGQCLRVGPRPAPCATVVGVAEDVREFGLTEASLSYYVSIDQFEPMLVAIWVRTKGSASRLSEPVRRAFQRLMPPDWYVEVRTTRHEVDSMTRQWRLGAMTFLALGAVALAVAAIGLYSVIAHGVAQRTRELGIRAAVGARSRDLIRLVVTDGLLVTSIGVSIGLVLALTAGPLVGPLLYAESPRDPIVYAIVGAVLLVVAMVASLRPALRASQVDPVLTLRSD